MALQHLRSSTASKRPDPAAMVDGQLAVNTNAASTGLFFKDSGGNLIKVGPVHVGTTAPNATPASGGHAGNSIGEQWLDTTGGGYVLKIWDGSAWQSEAGEFVNTSGDTMTGALVMDNQQQVRFRETTANGTNFVALQAPASVASDKTITLPDVTGTVVTTGDTGSVTSTMLLDGTILNADVNASAAIAGTKISPDFGSLNVVTTGTATAASLNPTGSSVPANGVYLPAANTVGVATNSTGRLFINSSGQVGLGSSSPRSNFDISKDGVVAAGNWYNLSHITDASGNKGFQLGYDNTSQTSILAASTTGTASNLQFYTYSGSAWGPRVTVTSGGSVGIGTSTFGAANHLLTVGNGYSVLNGLRISGADTANSIYQAGAFGLASDNYITFGTGASQTERGRWDSSGRFLVGTSTARSNFNNSIDSSPFQIEGTTADAAGAAFIHSGANNLPAVFQFAKQRSGAVGGNTIVQADDFTGFISFEGNDGAQFVRCASIGAQIDGTPGTDDMPGRLVFATTADGMSSPTERMRIANNGFVRISNSGSYLYGTTVHEISSNINYLTFGVYNSNASFTDTVSQVVASRNTSNSTYNMFKCSILGVADVLIIRDGGNVVNVNNSYGAISDIKLKENIVDANSQWDDLKALKVRNYNLKEGQTHTQIGLIAQEVELVSPGLVTEAPDRDQEGNDLGTVTKSVNYSVLYMKAVKALQEAMERIETLEAKVAALEGV